MKVKELIKWVEAEPARSAWARGVKGYACELLEQYAENWGVEADFIRSDCKKLKNGADSWSDYSWGGSALVCDCDIADRLCCPSELARCRGGDRRPNGSEEWLDVQARALYHADKLISSLCWENEILERLKK